MKNAYFKSPDIVNVHYFREGASYFEMTEMLVCSRRFSGETIFEKTYESSSNNKVLKVTDGYLYVSTTPDDGTGFYYYRYTKVNEKGNVEWTAYNPWSTQYEAINNISLQAFDIDNSVYLFYDNMYGLRIDSSGNIVWLKRFTFLDDQLSSVVFNNKGNFLLMGTHQYDYNGNGLTDESADLIFLEIGTDGKIVN